MRIAVWTPLPPEPSGIADYSYELLEHLADRVDVTAVVRTGFADTVSAPAGVAVVSGEAARAGQAGRFDLHVYHMGNHAYLHGETHAHALVEPGLVVLHDPSLFDFYATMLGGPGTVGFQHERAYNAPGSRCSVVGANGAAGPDRLVELCTRRLVEASRAVVVHSDWAAHELTRRHPATPVLQVHQGAPVLHDDLAKTGRSALGWSQSDFGFGVFGGISAPKRVGSVLAAFEQVLRTHPSARLVVAGRDDAAALGSQLRDFLRQRDLGDAVTLLTGVTKSELQAGIAACDLVVNLRWPTAGETSAIMMRAFGAGKAVITSDLPQLAGLSTEFCWTVPTDPGREQRALLELMCNALRDPEGTQLAGKAAREFVANEATWDLVAARHLAVIRSLVRSPAGRVDVGDGRQRSVTGGGHDRAPATSPPAVNAVVDLRATTGLAEAARRSIGALLVADVTVALTDFDSMAPHDDRRVPRQLALLPGGRPHDIDVWYLNVNEFHLIAEPVLRQGPRRPYVVASWFWELPALPPDYLAQLERVDEVWVASTFVRDVVRAVSDKPVTVLPCVVEPTPDPAITLADFGLVPGPCTFFFNFDANSSAARKNPFGVLAAYRKAFSAAQRAGDVRLVLKSMNLERHPEVRRRLREDVAALDGVLIEDQLTNVEMSSLLAVVDVYVSLHRSEGFGLGMAEAMYLGKPAIVTAYSANMDFTTQANSCLVGYTLRPVSGDDHRAHPGMERVYAPGQLWADPLVDQAARWMRRLHAHPAERTRIGAAAARTIRARCSRESVGRLMRERLEQIRLDRSLVAASG